MGSASYDPPPAPSYSDSQQEALASYKTTNPQYRADAVRNTLGSYMPTNAALLTPEYRQLSTTYDDAQANMANALKQSGGNEDAPAYVAAKTHRDRVYSDLFNYNQSHGIKDADTLGDVDIARAYAKAADDAGSDTARAQLALRQELGEKNAAQTRKELIAADPTGYARNELLKNQVYNDLYNSQGDTANLRTVLDADKAAYAAGPSRDLLRLRDDARNGLDSLGSSDLARIRNDARAEYALGSKLDASTAHEVEQASRAASASRGNILGNASAVSEAMSLGSAGEARKAQRTAALGVADSALFDRSNSLGSLLSGYDSAATADADRRRSNLLGSDTALYGRNQQALANKQSFALGSGLTNQFAGLGVAQSGTVGFNSSIGNQSANVANGNTGSQYALGLYQQQSQNAATAANQTNPWLNVAAGVVGTGLGAYTGGLGAGLASKTLSSGSSASPAFAPSSSGARTSYWG